MQAVLAIMGITETGIIEQVAVEEQVELAVLESQEDKVVETKAHRTLTI